MNKFLEAKAIKMNLISSSKCHNILWRHYTYIETHSKFITTIFLMSHMHYYKVEFCHYKGIRNMSKKSVLLEEEMNGKL